MSRKYEITGTAANFLGITESIQGTIKDGISFELDYDDDTYDIDAITAQITAEVEKILPNYLTLDGARIYLDESKINRRQVMNSAWLDSLQEKIQGIDFESVVEGNRK